MDGQQRLSSIRSFFSNEFKLRDLRVWPELNGRDYRDLPNKIRRGLERRGLSAVIILAESGKDAKDAMETRQYVFERLNTGGERLNSQEIRNCLYASNFNQMLISISRSDIFTSVWGIPPKESGEPHRVSRKLENNSLYARMADCELVLRYFALQDTDLFRKGMRKALDEQMIRCMDLTQSRCQQLESGYLETLRIASSIYGSGLFRLPKRSVSGLTGRRSIPLADAVMDAVRRFVHKKNELLTSADTIVAGTANALENSATYDLLVGKGNTKNSIDERLHLMYTIFEKSLHS